MPAFVALSFGIAPCRCQGFFGPFFLNKGHLVGESAVLKIKRQIGNVFLGGYVFFSREHVKKMKLTMFA